MCVLCNRSSAECQWLSSRKKTFSHPVRPLPCPSFIQILTSALGPQHVLSSCMHLPLESKDQPSHML